MGRDRDRTTSPHHDEDKESRDPRGRPSSRSPSGDSMKTTQHFEPVKPSPQTARRGKSRIGPGSRSRKPLGAPEETKGQPEEQDGAEGRLASETVVAVTSPGSRSRSRGSGRGSRGGGRGHSGSRGRGSRRNVPDYQFREINEAFFSAGPANFIDGDVLDRLTGKINNGMNLLNQAFVLMKESEHDLMVVKAFLQRIHDNAAGITQRLEPTDPNVSPEAENRPSTSSSNKNFFEPLKMQRNDNDGNRIQRQVSNDSASKKGKDGLTTPINFQTSMSPFDILAAQGDGGDDGGDEGGGSSGTTEERMDTDDILTDEVSPSVKSSESESGAEQNLNEENKIKLVTTVDVGNGATIPMNDEENTVVPGTAFEDFQHLGDILSNNDSSFFRKFEKLRKEYKISEESVKSERPSTSRSRSRPRQAPSIASSSSSSASSKIIKVVADPPEKSTGKEDTETPNGMKKVDLRKLIGGLPAPCIRLTDYDAVVSRWMSEKLPASEIQKRIQYMEDKNNMSDTSSSGLSDPVVLKSSYIKEVEKKQNLKRRCSPSKESKDSGPSGSKKRKTGDPRSSKKSKRSSSSRSSSPASSLVQKKASWKSFEPPPDIKEKLQERFRLFKEQQKRVSEEGKKTPKIEKQTETESPTTSKNESKHADDKEKIVEVVEDKAPSIAEVERKKAAIQQKLLETFRIFQAQNIEKMPSSTDPAEPQPPAVEVRKGPEQTKKEQPAKDAEKVTERSRGEADTNKDKENSESKSSAEKSPESQPADNGEVSAPRSPASTIAVSRRSKRGGMPLPPPSPSIASTVQVPTRRRDSKQALILSSQPKSPRRKVSKKEDDEAGNSDPVDNPEEQSWVKRSNSQAPERFERTLSLISQQSPRRKTKKGNEIENRGASSSSRPKTSVAQSQGEAERNGKGGADENAEGLAQGEKERSKVLVLPPASTVLASPTRKKGSDIKKDTEVALKKALTMFEKQKSPKAKSRKQKQLAGPSSRRPKGGEADVELPRGSNAAGIQEDENELEEVRKAVIEDAHVIVVDPQEILNHRADELYEYDGEPQEIVDMAEVYDDL